MERFAEQAKDFVFCSNHVVKPPGHLEHCSGLIWENL